MITITPYSKYRIYVTKNSIGNKGCVSINSWKGYENFLKTVDIFQGGAYSADSSYSPPTTDAAKAFDGDAGTYWESSSNAIDHWLRVDLPSPKSLRVIYLSSKAFSNEVPKDFLIQGSNDGTNWTTIVSYTDWVTTNVTRENEWAIHLYMAGTSIQSDGLACQSVLIFNWNTGELRAKLTPALNGSWEYFPEKNETYLIVHQGNNGFRPMADGPVNPTAA